MDHFVWSKDQPFKKVQLERDISDTNMSDTKKVLDGLYEVIEKMFIIKVHCWSS